MSALKFIFALHVELDEILLLVQELLPKDMWL